MATDAQQPRSPGDDDSAERQLARIWRDPWVRFQRSQTPLVWALALVIGLAVGYAAIAFRLAIETVQFAAFGTWGEHLASYAATLPWWQVLIAPAAGGLAVGLILHYLMPGGRPEAVADVIEARALKDGDMPAKNGIVSAAIAAISLGAGASAGREGPIVHLGGSLASLVARRFSFPPEIARTLLGCGAAAAVSASFNAPIAGALFALEVVLRHYAPRAFAPIVIASVMATVVSRVHLGEFPAFIIPDYGIMSYWEFPAFGLLGLVCALTASIFMASLMTADDIARRLTLPLWLRPVIGGLAVGAIAIWVPEVLGVGYEATDKALKEEFTLTVLILLIAAKTTATAITYASRFGGGVFSPSLYLGAMTGGAFGLIAASVLPDYAAGHGLYAIVGMGAVAAAVLGAPISTILIVSELIGNYQVTIASMVAVSISTVFTQALLGRSFFYWQLERRGFDIQGGPHLYVMQTLAVRDFMRHLDTEADREAAGVAAPSGPDEPRLYPGDTLEHALAMLEVEANHRLPVMHPDEPDTVVGLATREAALRAFNRALVEAHEEEHH